MSIDLAQPGPIDQADPKFRKLLADLQGNILKSHGRDYAVHVFFRFGQDRPAVRRMLRSLTDRYVTSAAAQEAQSRHYRQGGERQSLFGSLMLSARGLGKLGLELPPGFGEAVMQPATTAPVSFAAPMKAAAAVLGDQPAQWDSGYRAADIDAMLLLAMGHAEGPFDADAIPTALLDAARAAQALIGEAAQVVAFELGQQQRRGEDAVEHFGFVDGISQPALLREHLPAPGGMQKNDPSASLDLALVKDPFKPAEDAHGSFFVFRKLEQNVALFRAEQAKLARDLDGIDEALAGAMMVGRFADGTPVLHGAATGSQENDFNYEEDAAPPAAFPSRCPFQAHIRKTNPRGDTARQFGTPENAAAIDAAERRRRVVRRGITYGARDNGLKDAPERGVGLLFQCYQSSIPDQFAFMQNFWANNEDFVRPGSSGHDSIIGQGPRNVMQNWPSPFGQPTQKSLPGQPQLVTDKGGEFFWTPSMAFLRGLGEEG